MFHVKIRNFNKNPRTHSFTHEAEKQVLKSPEISLI